MRAFSVVTNTTWDKELSDYIREVHIVIADSFHFSHSGGCSGHLVFRKKIAEYTFADIVAFSDWEYVKEVVPDAD